MLISYATWLGSEGLKQAVITHGLSVQRNDEGPSWYVFAADGGVVHETRILKDGGAEQTDFEASFASLTGRAVSSTQLYFDKSHPAPATNDGRLRATAEKPTGTRLNFFSHNYCDKTTWYQQSTRVVNETAQNSGNNLTYNLAHPYVIDVYHGKLTFEDDLKDASGNSYRVSVKVNGVTKTEQDPHFASGGDYTVDYVLGKVTFLSALDPSDVVTVTYYYAGSSRFTVSPPSGSSLLINLAEAQFALDVDLKDTTVFEVWGYADSFLSPAQMSALGIPAGVGYKIRVQRNAYKTMSDFYNDTFKSYPTYKAIGSPGNWRSQPADITVLEWDYLSSVTLYSSMGMEVRVLLEHDTAFTGYLATASFYCLATPE